MSRYSPQVQTFRPEDDQGFLAQLGRGAKTGYGLGRQARQDALDEEDRKLRNDALLENMRLARNQDTRAGQQEARAEDDQDRQVAADALQGISRTPVTSRVAIPEFTNPTGVGQINVSTTGRQLSPNRYEDYERTPVGRARAEKLRHENELYGALAGVRGMDPGMARVGALEPSTIDNTPPYQRPVAEGLSFAERLALAQTNQAGQDRRQSARLADPLTYGNFAMDMKKQAETNLWNTYKLRVDGIDAIVDENGARVTNDQLNEQQRAALADALYWNKEVQSVAGQLKTSRGLVDRPGGAVHADPRTPTPQSLGGSSSSSSRGPIPVSQQDFDDIVKAKGSAYASQHYTVVGR